MPLSRRRFLAAAAALAAGACEPSQPPAQPGPVGGPTPPGQPRTRKIILVGAGLSGLSIALDLIDKGYDPLILEASQRPGGRILTLREPFRDGLYVEAGATYVIPDPLLLDRLRLAGVEVAPFGPRKKGLSSVVLRGDKRLVIPAGEEPPDPYPLTPEERAAEGAGMANRYFPGIEGIDVTQPLPATLLQHDSVSAADYLRKLGASPGYMRMVHDALVPNSPLEELSALFLMREIANIHREIGLPRPAGNRIAGGSDTFPKALAQRLGERILYGAKVTRIEQTPTGVKVTFTKGGQNQVVEGERAVSTLPSTVLRDVEFAPVLSEGKLRALKELWLVSVTRVWLGVKERYWEVRGEGGDVESDAPMGNVRHETEQQAGKGGVLGIYAVGEEARRLAALGEGPRIQAARDYMERAHPGLAAQSLEGASKCWDSDPLQKGAYAEMGPGQLTTLVPELARAEGRLHFAGDQTSYRPGFMHGALASVKRVVEEIVRAG